MSEWEVCQVVLYRNRQTGQVERMELRTWAEDGSCQATPIENLSETLAQLHTQGWEEITMVPELRVATVGATLQERKTFKRRRQGSIG